MLPHQVPLIARVEAQIRRRTYNRVRDLSVEEVRGRIVVRGRVPSHHSRQLALEGMLELLPRERFATEIRVA